MLRAEHVKIFQDTEKLKSIYLEAFPENERVPLWLLKLMTLKKGVDFLSFYDDVRLCGLSYLISNQDLTFVLYLAVDSSIRSKGYGSRILQWIKENKNGTIALHIDTVQEQASDYEQRVSRKCFYERNGFRDTGSKLADGNNVFDVLAYGDGYSQEKYTRLLRSFFNGFYQFTLE